jgi:uncharacterized protein DUF6010
MPIVAQEIRMALISILLLYLIIGCLAALGSVTITRHRFSPRNEQVFYSLLLIPVAAMYLAFLDYFQSPASLRIELWAASAFVAMALLGTRFSLLVIVGYALHGAWDVVHEVVAHQIASAESASSLTPIPLAYGSFCAAYDWCIAGYFYTRRHQRRT